MDKTCKTCKYYDRCKLESLSTRTVCRNHKLRYWMPATSAQLLERTLGSSKLRLKGDIANGYTYNNTPEITKVIYNGPATIVFWSDGTKTVSKCDSNDKFDPEKGIAICIVKKLYGNNYSYNSVIGKWIPECSATESLMDSVDRFLSSLRSFKW